MGAREWAGGLRELLARLILRSVYSLSEVLKNNTLQKRRMYIHLYFI